MRILLIDDHDMVAAGIRGLLGAAMPGVEILVAGTGEEALRLHREEPCDVVVLDLMIPGIGGVETARRLRAASPGVKILVLTAHLDETNARQALLAGVDGVMAKTSSMRGLLFALEAIQAGGLFLDPSLGGVLVRRFLQASVATDRLSNLLIGLTRREREVLGLLLQGDTSRAMAQKFGLSEKTVHKHRASLLEKMEVKTSRQLKAMRPKLWPLLGLNGENGAGR